MARPTREERRERSAEITRRERVEQGLPEQVEDPATYGRLGRLYADADRDRAGRAS